VHLIFSNVGNLGERSADILVGFGAFVNQADKNVGAPEKGEMVRIQRDTQIMYSLHLLMLCFPFSHPHGKNR
jgi:hypothetical protein